MSMLATYQLKASLDSIRIHSIGVILLLDILAIGLGGTALISFRILCYLTTFFLVPWAKFRVNSTGVIIFSLIAYVFILALFNSSSPVTSFDAALKTNLSLWLYLYVFAAIKSRNDFFIISQYCYRALIASILIVLAANVLKFGEVNYRDSSILFGASGVNIVKSMTLYALMSIPFLVQYERIKSIESIAVFGSFLSIVLLATKRSAILAIVIYLVIFVVLNSKDIKKMILPGVIFFLSISYTLGTSIVERIGNRSGRFDLNNPEELEKEWRLIESLIVIDNFSSGTLRTKLFGFETFNEISALNLRYMFHNDFAVLLGSLGLVGIAMYLFLLIDIIKFYLSRIRNVRSIPVFKWLYIVLFLSLIIFAISGNFKTLGGTLGTLMVGFAMCLGLSSLPESQLEYIK